MMKNKSLKAAGFAVVLLTMAIIPATAKNAKQSRNMPNQPNRPEMCDDNMRNMPGRGMGHFELIGEVSNIDESKQILTIRDVDGKDHQVHINAFTRSKEIDVTSTNNNNVKLCAIKDFSKGDTVVVDSMDTDTTILEARMVAIVKK